MLSRHIPDSRARPPHICSFGSAKTTTPIACRNQIVFNALLQASLDPQISAILAPGEFDPGCDFRVIPTGAEKRVRVRVVSGDECSADGDTDDIILDECSVMMEPRRTDAILVWSCRKRWVSPGDQIRVQHALSESGPMSLVEVARFATGSSDGVAAVLALICRNFLEIDLNEAGLSPETIVRRRDRLF